MNKKWVYTMLAAVALTAAAPAASVTPLAPVVSAAAEHTISVDRTNAARGQSVTVSGMFEPSAWITMRAIDSEGQIVAFDAVRANAQGNYSISFVVPDNAAVGTMTVYTGAGDEVQSAVVNVRSGSRGSGGSGGAPIGQPGSPGETAPETAADGKIVVRPTLTEDADGRAVAAVTIGEQAVLAAMGPSGDRLTIEVDAGDAAVVSVNLTPDALRAFLSAASASAVLEIVVPAGSYLLPVSVLDRDALADALEAAADEVGLQIVIASANAGQSAGVSGAAGALGATAIAPAIDFSVQGTAGDKLASLDFGTTYVERTLNVDGALDAASSTGVVYDEATNTLRFVPSVFATASGRTVATLKRNGNSLYTVVAHKKAFADLPITHWGKADIELLASKLIVNGVSDNAFAPSAAVTRAEFAALIVRALGLQENGEPPFADVSRSKWYAGAVGAAFEAGLVTGYEDNTFRPEQRITRQELAVLIDNAMAFAGERDASDMLGAGGQAAGFRDQAAIAAWARDAVDRIAAAGIAEGRDDGTFDAVANSTRAEAAAMIKRLLQHIGFIN